MIYTESGGYLKDFQYTMLSGFGSYRAFSIDLKCLNDTIPGQRMKIVAGRI